MTVPLVNRELWKARQNDDILYTLEGYILNVGNIKGVIAMAKTKNHILPWTVSKIWWHWSRTLNCCWQIYIYIYIHTHTHTYTYTYVHTHIYIYIYTLTGSFIRYTLLVPGWTPFAFRTALILRGIDSTRCWKHSSEILVHIDMIESRSCCRFVGFTSMMRISRSTTSQMCSLGLRSDERGGHLSKVNSLSCSRNQSEMIWALWHGALSFWK